MSKLRRFVDSKLIKITSGSGGDGSISFDRSKSRFGPANGGNGGTGGSVFIVCSSRITCLNSLERKYRAANGSPGLHKQQHGANAKNIEVHVPVSNQFNFNDKNRLEQRLRKCCKRTR